MKCKRIKLCISGNWSPSMRREWIEMQSMQLKLKNFQLSPSMRREWIEMVMKARQTERRVSPSMRREWIEMFR